MARTTLRFRATGVGGGHAGTRRPSAPRLAVRRVNNGNRKA